MTPAPNGFDLARFYQGIYLFQSWEVFAGHKTVGPKDVAVNLDAMGFPADLTGKRVLDVAPWNGFFSFECARRGAAEVVSLGPEDPTHTGFEQTRILLGFDQVRYVRGSVYGLDPAVHGMFDVVLCLGLIYHLRHPAYALDRIHDVCRDRFFCDTPMIDRVVFDKTVSEEEREAILAAGDVINRLPMFYFTPASETGDAYNWFMPNMRAFRAIVESSGFTVDLFKDDGHAWSWIGATKSERPFVEGLEGYNPGSARV